MYLRDQFAILGFCTQNYRLTKKVMYNNKVGIWAEFQQTGNSTCTYIKYGLNVELITDTTVQNVLVPSYKTSVSVSQIHPWFLQDTGQRQAWGQLMDGRAWKYNVKQCYKKYF